MPTPVPAAIAATADAPFVDAAGRVHHTISQRLQYSHQRLAELIVANPAARNVDLAAYFGVTNQHIGMLRASDAFQAILAQTQQDVLPGIREEIAARMHEVANRSLERIQEKLAKPAEQISDSLLIKAAELGARGVGIGGFGASNPPPTPPASDRLERLAERLTALMPDRKEGAIDVEVREVSAQPAA